MSWFRSLMIELFPAWHEAQRLKRRTSRDLATSNAIDRIPKKIPGKPDVNSKPYRYPKPDNDGA